MRRWGLTMAAAVLLLAALLGCRRAAADPGPLVYRRSGGIAGVELVLTIESDGSARLEQGGRAVEWELSEEWMEDLRARLDDVDLAAVEEPGPLGQGRDLFEYELTYGGETVHTRDTQVPEDLAPVLELLAEAVAESPR